MLTGRIDVLKLYVVSLPLPFSENMCDKVQVCHASV
jgi:hypothetical protein